MKKHPKEFQSFEIFKSFLEKKFFKIIEFEILLYEKDGRILPYFSLERVEVDRKQRRQGYGTKFLQLLCDFCDYNNLRFELMPVPLSEEMRSLRLVNFYRRFGFRYIKRSKCIMRRTPKVRQRKGA